MAQEFAKIVGRIYRPERCTEHIVVRAKLVGVIRRKLRAGDKKQWHVLTFVVGDIRLESVVEDDSPPTTRYLGDYYVVIDHEVKDVDRRNMVYADEPWQLPVVIGFTSADDTLFEGVVSVTPACRMPVSTQ